MNPFPGPKRRFAAAQLDVCNGGQTGQSRATPESPFLPQADIRDGEAIAGRKLSSRCTFVEGDFFEMVPEADMHVLKRVIHDWNDAQSRQILSNCARALRPRGRVVLIETLLPDDGRPSDAPLMDLNMLVLLPERERTTRQYRELLQAAGLHLDRVIETASPMQILEASAAGSC